MEVQVTRRLNIRARHPQVLPDNLLGTLERGYRFEVVEKVKGGLHDGLDDWYKDAFGQYYWAGGLEEVVDPLPAISAPAVRMDWRTQLDGIPQEWIATRGKGVKVAVLDSGIWRGHPDLMHVKEGNCRNFVGGNPDDIRDANGHGTHCAGLIGARGKTNESVIGVAPEVELYIARVNHPEHSHTAPILKQAIEWAIRKNVDIISMSLDCLQAGCQEILSPVITRAAEKGIIIAAAAGDDKNLRDLKRIFPASHDKTISVGAIRQYHLQNVMESGKVRDVDLILPNRGMLSTGKSKEEQYMKIRGSSQSTAFVCGITSLLLSGTKICQQFQGEELVDEVRKQLRGISNSYISGFQYAQNRIQLLRAI